MLRPSNGRPRAGESWKNTRFRVSPAGGRRAEGKGRSRESDGLPSPLRRASRLSGVAWRGTGVGAVRAGPGGDLRRAARAGAGEGGRRSRRRRLEGRPGDRAPIRVRPGREYAGPGTDRMLRRLRRGAPLRRLPGARSRPFADPGPPHRPGQRGAGRLRGARPRHLQRRATRLPALREPARRADGRLPQRRRQPDRHRRGVDGGPDLGRHLELGGPHHRRRVRGRDRDPVHLAPLPSPPGRSDLGVPGAPLLSAEPASPDRPRAGRPQPLLHTLPGGEARRVRRDRPRPEPGARPDRHRAPHRRAGGVSGRAARPGSGRRIGRANGALGRHPQPQPQRHPQSRLLPGRGRHPAAHHQHALQALLPGEAPLLHGGGRLLHDAVQRDLHPHRGPAGLGRQADREGWAARAGVLRRAR